MWWLESSGPFTNIMSKCLIIENKAISIGGYAILQDIDVLAITET